MRLVWSTACVWLCIHAASAQTTPPPAEADATAGFWTRANLLGDAGGVRPGFGNLGITIGLQDTNEALGNVSGGIHRGASYDGVTLMSAGLDTQRAFGWEGGTFNVSAWNIRGRNIASDNLLSLQTPSGILAAPTTRLWEAWFQQSLFDGAVDVKLGQQSLDQEFMTSQGSSLFINTMMGWPMVPSADLYAGGPAYPLSSLGVRLRAQPGHSITGMFGLFADNPPGGPFNDDGQLRGSTRWGGNFNLRTGALIVGEVQYALNQPNSGGKDGDTASTGLPGAYKLGFWYDSAAFPDQRFDNTGLSLAAPSSSGIPLMRRNNFSVYGVADQMVWRAAADSPSSLDVFVRLMSAPGDRNLISFSVNAGVTLKAPLPGRDDDTAGIGFGVAKVSHGASAFAGDQAAFSGTAAPRRGSETFIEITYQCQLAGWWQLQPDFQYVFNPGGGILDPNHPVRRVSDEAILGLRSIVTF